MDDLSLDPTEIASWFAEEHGAPFILTRVSAETVARWLQALPPIVRRCYILDNTVEQNAARLDCTRGEIIASVLPDHGSVMSGDFGEIVAYLHRSSVVAGAFGPKKWRLKHDRTKPTPGSDVVHFVLPDWPNTTDRDFLVCSEVKSKATEGQFAPITTALSHLAKDVTSRLAKTLVWLRERAMTTDLGDVQLAHLDRFINLSDHPVARREFVAVAVIAESIAPDELLTVPAQLPADRTLVVIVVPQLRDTYMSVFDAATLSLG